MYDLQSHNDVCFIVLTFARFCRRSLNTWLIPLVETLSLGPCKMIKNEKTSMTLYLRLDIAYLQYFEL